MYGQSENAGHRFIQRIRVLRGLIRSGAVVTGSHLELVKQRAVEGGADPVLVAGLDLQEPTTEADRAEEAALLRRFGWVYRPEVFSPSARGEPCGQRCAQKRVPRKGEIA